MCLKRKINTRVERLSTEWLLEPPNEIVAIVQEEENYVNNEV